MATYRKEDIVNRVRAGADLTKVAIDNLDLSQAALPNAKMRTASFNKVSFEDADLTNGDLRQSFFQNCVLRSVNGQRLNVRQSKFVACIIDGGMFSKSQFDGIQGEKLSLREANFEEAGFTQVALSQSNLENAIFRSANLEGAGFTRCLLTSVDFLGANLSAAQFNQCDLRSSVLDGHNLSNIKLNGSRLSNAKLNKCTAVGANFSGMDFEGADFNGSTFDDAKFLKSQLAASKYREANISRTFFDGADLNNTFFMGATLNTVSFKGCNLEDAYFVNARMENIDFSESNLRGVNFSNAHLTKLKLAGADLKNVNFEGAALNSVSFAGARNLLFARWSPVALESFAKTKMREAMQHDFQALQAEIAATKQRRDTEAVGSYTDDLFRLLREMAMMIEPPVVRKEIEELGRWLLNQGRESEQAGDIIEAEDCRDKFQHLSRLWQEATGDTLDLRPSQEQGPKHFLIIGLDDSGVVVQNFTTLLNKMNDAYQTGFSGGGEEDFLSGLDNLFHQPLALTGSRSDPWELTFAGEAKGLTLLAWIFLATISQQAQTEVKKILAERDQVAAERDQAANSGDGRAKLLAEKLHILEAKARMADDLAKQIRRGQSDLVRHSTQEKIYSNEDWKTIDADTKGSKYSDIRSLITQSKIGGRLALQIDDRSAFDVTFRLLG